MRHKNSIVFGTLQVVVLCPNRAPVRELSVEYLQEASRCAHIPRRRFLGAI